MVRRHLTKSTPLPGQTADSKVTLSVNGKYTQNFRIGEGRLRCKECERIETDVRRPYRVRAVKGDETTPLIRANLVKPHLCVFMTLVEIERLYKLRHISAELMDGWFAVNGGDYQMGDSPKCMLLWRDFTHRAHKPEPPDHVEKLRISQPRFVQLVKCSRHAGLFVKLDWNMAKHEREFDWLDELWCWSSDADRAKTTISAGQLMKMVSKVQWARERVTRRFGVLSAALPNVTITALLIHILGNPEADRNFELLSKYKYCCLDVTAYQEVFKAISIAIRRTGHFPDGTKAHLNQVTAMAGWELAVGRSKNKTDWAEERRKRTTVRLNLGAPIEEKKTPDTNNTYIDLLKGELRKIMDQLIRPANRYVSWSDFVKDRQSWVSSGSTGGLKVRLDDGTMVRANKHALFETLTHTEMVKWIDGPAEIRATASEKFEMGKARAIYGTGVADYSVHAYVLADVEPNMSRVDGIEYGLRGRAVLATMVRRLAEVQNRDPECTNVDYADFNYQHTLAAQAATYEILADTLSSAGHHPDKVRAARWCATSLLNQYVKFPELGGGYLRVEQGMFSGFRGTNFLNTILNVAYFKTAERQVADMFGVFPVELFHIHQGDDVWISNMSRLWAVALFNVMVATGLEFQPSKQMFERKKGEFLRVVYDKDGARGYLARKVATMIMKPIQNTEVVTPAERAVAMNDQLSTMVRRGYDLAACRLLWDAIVPYAARSSLGQGKLTIPRGILMKSHLDNGLDIGHPRTAAVRGAMVAALPTMELKSAIMERSLASHMTDDWIELVSGRFRDTMDTPALRESIHRINITDSLRQEDRTMGLRKYEREMREYLAKVQVGTVVRHEAAYRELCNGPTAGLAFEMKLNELCSNLLVKESVQERSTIASIMCCVGQSTFKSVSTAMVATRKSKLDALLMCVEQAPDSAARTKSLATISEVVKHCGVEVMVSLIGGIGAGANKYYSEFHPDVLSWVQAESVDYTIERAVRLQVTDVDRFRAMVDEDFDAHVRSARADGRLLFISQY